MTDTTQDIQSAAPDAGPFGRGPAQLWTAKPNGALDWVNETVTSYFGRTFDEMIQWGWSALVHPDDFAEVGERWVAAIESGEPYEVRFRLKATDGAYRWHVGRATATKNAAGQVERWVGANLDVEGLIGEL